MNSADLDAARLILQRMGITPEQLLTVQPANRQRMPTFREYVERVTKAVPAGTRRAYATYWRRVVDAWGDRLIDEPTPLEVAELCETMRTAVAPGETHAAGALPWNTKCPRSDAFTATRSPTG